jgi:multimeric flavodoxin WrbA
MSKIAVLIGSPRKNGNTEILANSFISGVDKKKNSVEVIHVIGKKVNGCIDCGCKVETDKNTPQECANQIIKSLFLNTSRTGSLHE